MTTCPQEVDAAEHPELFTLAGDAPVAKPSLEPAAAEPSAAAASVDDRSDPSTSSGRNAKRKAYSVAAAPAPKRAKEVDGVIDLYSDADWDGSAAGIGGDLIEID